MLKTVWFAGFILLSAAYFYAAIKISITHYLWLDDILAVTAAEQRSWGGVWKAIWGGLDFSPPTFHFFLHGLAQLTGMWDSRLIWRLPSILAVYGTGVCMLCLSLRYLSPFSSLVVFGIVISNELFDFAVQVRPYALLSLGLAGALTLWDGFEHTPHRRFYTVALWLIASACLSLHFYGFIPVVAICVAELLWLISRRQIRWGIWGPLFLTIPVEAAWTPLALHLGALNSQDNKSPAFYGHPSCQRFLEVAKKTLLGGSEGQTLLLAIGIVVIALLVLRQLSDKDASPLKVKFDFSLKSPLAIIIISTVILPFIAYAFSFLITKNFNLQYAVCASISTGLVVGALLDLVPFRPYVVTSLLVLLLAFLYMRPAHKIDEIQITLAMFDGHLEPLPIVVENGKDFVELHRAANENLRKSLVFLFNDPDFKSPDPTNEHIVKWLIPFIPEAQVEQRKDFLKEHQDFYILFGNEHSISSYSPWFFTSGWTENLVKEANGAYLFRVSQSR